MQYIPIWEKKAWDEGVAAGINQGIEQGIERGIERGIEKGVEKEKFSTATRLLLRGFDLNDIASLTGVAIDVIKKLALDIQIPQSSH